MLHVGMPDDSLQARMISGCTCAMGAEICTTCRPARLPTLMRQSLGLPAGTKHASLTVTHCPCLSSGCESAAGDHRTRPSFFIRHEKVAAATGCSSLGWKTLVGGGHNLQQRCHVSQLGMLTAQQIMDVKVAVGEQRDFNGI